jgi:MoaE-MoaD fusion protein
MVTPLQEDIYQLVREPIDVAALARHVQAPEDGATVTFDGFVRNQSHNRSTLYLDYEAYESMAIAKMREIGAQLR